jgi:hypothetical protein
MSALAKDTSGARRGLSRHFAAGEEERMPSRLTRVAFAVVALGSAATALGACTYVERERPPQQATVVVPQQPQPTVVTPAQPTVTVRPGY